MYMGYKLDYKIIEKAIFDENKRLIGHYYFDKNHFIEIIHCLEDLNQKFFLSYYAENEFIFCKEYLLFLVNENTESLFSGLADIMAKFIKDLLNEEPDTKGDIFINEYARLIGFFGLFKNNEIFLVKKSNIYLLSYVVVNHSHEEKTIKTYFLNDTFKTIFMFNFLFRGNRIDFREIFLENLNLFLNKTKYNLNEYQNFLNETESLEIEYMGTYSFEKAHSTLKNTLLDLIS